jgi:hypothetical protein
MTIQYRALQIFKIHHKSSINKFTSILMKLKYTNYPAATQTSLHCIVVVVAAGGSSCVWVQGAVSKVASHPTAVM